MVDHTHRVLIIDAPDNNRHELYSALASKGYDLTSSASGQEALDLLRNSKFDLILLGAELPDVSSRDILVHVKSVYQATPVIIVSNDLDTATMMQSMELGADEFIHEPLNLPVILMRIKTTIQKTRSQEERMQQILHVSEHMNNIIMVPESVGLDSKQSVNIDTYLQHALTEFKQIYNADAGTIYVREGRVLRFAAVQTDSLGLAFGGTTEIPLNFQPLNLYDEHSGEPNYRNVASYVALKGETVSSPDLSAEHLFDFSAVRIFDERNHYKSVACLAVPLKNHKKEVIGVLQLINARDDQGQIIPFDPAKRLITESLCS